METTSIVKSSSFAPAVSSSSQKHPWGPSSSVIFEEIVEMKSTKQKKKKRRLDQYKLTRKEVPDNAKALEVSVIDWYFISLIIQSEFL